MLQKPFLRIAFKKQVDGKKRIWTWKTSLKKKSEQDSAFDGYLLGVWKLLDACQKSYPNSNPEMGCKKGLQKKAIQQMRNLHMVKTLENECVI